MGETMKELTRELKFGNKKYEELKESFSFRFNRLTFESPINEYHSLMSTFSELSTVAAQIASIKNHIDMVEAYSNNGETDSRLNKANKNIETLVCELVDYRKEALGSGNCPYYGENRPCEEYGNDCGFCKKTTFEKEKEEMIDKYTVL